MCPRLWVEALLLRKDSVSGRAFSSNGTLANSTSVIEMFLTAQLVFAIFMLAGMCQATFGEFEAFANTNA